ncbi:MAG: hypothetical protein WCP59_17680 [Actinomycetota bacterium]
MLRSRRFALIATIAVLGLSACGESGSTVTSAKAPTVIHLGAGGTRSAAANVEGAASDKMMVMQDITYVFDGSYPELGTTGKSWTLPAGTKVDAAVVAKIAALLGVEGDVRQLPADQGGGWMVGAADYSTASLTVANDGLLSWWFSPAPATATSGGCAIADGTVGRTSAGSETLNPAGATSGTDAVAPDTAVAPPDSVVVDPVPAPCEVPAPPANVPDKAAATVKAKQFLTSLGLDPSQYEFTTYADDYSASVTAWLLLDGHRSPLQINLGYGGEGVLQWASGSLAAPQASDEYPLVTPEEGLARLNDQAGMWMAYGGGGVLRGVASDVATKAVANGIAPGGGSTDSVAVGAGGAAVAPVPVCDPAADCVIEPGTMPPAVPITVRVSGVRLDVTMVWADDGTVWLLPAYTFTSTDGGEYTVIAVDDQYIAQPEPTPVDTTPVDTVPGTDVTAPVDTTPVDTTPVTDLPQPVDSAAAATALVGLSVDEATKVAEGNGWTLRVSTLDGEGQMLTDDYSPTRVNVAVTAGSVSGVDSIG